MSIMVMSHVWRSSRHKGSDLLLLLAIADFANDEGVAYPSVKTLAAKTRLQIRNVQYRLRVLQKSQELTILLNVGPHGTHIYKVHIGVQSLQGEKTIETTRCKDGGAIFAGEMQSLQGAIFAPPMQKHVDTGVQCSAYNPSLEDPSGKEKKTPSGIATQYHLPLDNSPAQKQEALLSAQDQQPPVADPSTAQQYSVGFRRFWVAYPIKKGKATAWGVWKKQKCESLTDVIVESIAAHATHDRDWQRGFVKHPTTYLKGECWEDEFVEGAVITNESVVDAVMAKLEEKRIGHARNVTPRHGTRSIGTGV